MTGFVRTSEEVAAIRDRMAENRFLDTRSVTVRYRSRPTVVEAVLPPGLEPTDEPLVEAEVVEVGGSNCVGSFAGGGLYVRARHGDLVGWYCLALPMSTDVAVRWGRDLFGEPKKRATVELDREGESVTGRVARRDTDLLAVEATVDHERDVDPGTRTVFHYKALPDVTGRGFQFDPVLVRVDFESDLHRFETGTGSVTLGETAHDPWADVAVEEVLGVAWAEADLSSSQSELATVDPESFAPYAYARGADDWLALDTRPADDVGSR